MNWLPLVGFYYRRHAQIQALLSKGSAGKSSVVLDFVKANAPVIKKHWPEVNGDGLLDDVVATLEAVMSDGPDPGSNYPDNTQR